MSDHVVYLSIAVSVALSVICCVAVGAERNVLANAGFEQADSEQPAFWAKRTPDDAERRLVWAADEAHSGERSLQITNSADVLSRWRTGHLGDIPILPGKPCTLRGWIKTKGVTGDAHFRLYFMTPGGSISAQPQSRGLKGEADWTLIELAYTAPDDTGYVMVYPELNGVGTAWFDDIELVGEVGDRVRRTGVEPEVYDASRIEFDPGEGCELVRRDARLVVQTRQRAGHGHARVAFWGETARYDITLTCRDEPRGAGTVRVAVDPEQSNDIILDTVTEGSARLVQRTVRGVDLQRYSTLELQLIPDGDERCGIASLSFKPVGRFGGTLLSAEELPPPRTLRLFVQPDEEAQARAMLPQFISKYATGPAQERREAELDALKAPEEWRARQRRTRGRLAEFFGPWPEKTALNARVVGKIDRDKYVIEKLIFESRPDYHVTANVYVPKGRPLPAPGVIFTCGHAADGKAAVLYHECCLGLVLKGYVVLALDPMGQGERCEYFDRETREHIVRLCVPQHHQLGRPSFLVGRTLSGHRTWDCIRAVDYLVSRPEVDAEKLAAVGNSGGGQMALLITAADERIKVCAAAHPGGSMENTYLPGRSLIDREVLSLIPPRPCRMIVGEKSGEEGGHRRKMEDMLRFYEGLGVGTERGELVLVDGVHDMKQPKREAAYEWVNRWLGKEEEGKAEPELQPEDMEALNCTETGFSVISLGGETGKSLNESYMEQIMPRRTAPRDGPEARRMRAELRNNVGRRLGLDLPPRRSRPTDRRVGQFADAGFEAIKGVYQSEPGIEVPALWLAPRREGRRDMVVVHVAEGGKPRSAGALSLAVALAAQGNIVVSIDVRGVGELDPWGSQEPSSYDGYDRTQWTRDCLAIDAAYAGRTMLAMRVLDLVRCLDYLEYQIARPDPEIVLVGEGLGGVWALVAAAFDERIEAVICKDTLLSYTMLVRSKYHRVRGYFWVPGALHDFDLPDLAALVAPRPVLWLDGIDAMAERVDEAEAAEAIGEWPGRVYAALGAPDGLQIARTDDGTHEQAAEAIAEFLQKQWSGADG